MSKGKCAKFVKILGKDHLKCMTQHVRECWEKESYSNVTFTCKTESGSPKKYLSANKAVLATASRRLYCMLEDTDGDNNVDIFIPESDFDSIKMLLQYIYTGEVTIVDNFAKDDLESLIRDWEIGCPEKPSSAVAVNPRQIEQYPDAINANDVSSSSTSSIMKKNSIMDNREQSKPKASSQTRRENELSLITEPTRQSTRSMNLRSCNINRDPSSSNTRKAAEMVQSMEKFDAAATLIDLSEAYHRDQNKDKEDLLLSEVLLNEETKRNKSLSAAKEELMEAIQRHQLYVNHFIGPQNSTVLTLGKSQRERRNQHVSCSTCGKQVLRRYLNYHMLTTHGNERPFLCEQCGATFAVQLGLTHHMKHSHVPKEVKESKSEVFICDVCNKVLRTKVNLRIHMRVHSGEKRYSCPFCDKKFRQHTTMARHKRIHTGAKPYSCKECVRSFSTSDSYNRHLETKAHIEKLSEKTLPFTCDTCEKGFGYEYQFLMHEIQHRTEESEQKCFKCPEIFSSISLLENHVRDQHQDGIFKCQHCSNYYSSQSRLDEHLVTHTDLEPVAAFLCNQCGKSYKSQTRVDAHVKAVHITERPFKCRFCPKDYKDKKNLVKHERTHTGEKPYSCPHCPRTYNRGTNLKIHIRTHTGEKPYVCGQCGKSFASSDNLKSHLKTHTGNKINCKTCGQVFRAKVDLEAHELTHSDNICGEHQKENGRQIIRKESNRL